ncbi:LPIN [Mytilus edulis]|uniref:phosphatidate phosphatase n=1 Tax=Mytilus edulis TaxID=6550 RepID=A0A8S3QAA5_MYTED|nr:LPIN [Mytilus edulis]
MKNYLPGYYLRSLRNRPLVEIDAEEISSTIQVHQYEVQKTRKRKNLKAFEEMSNQEFIRNAIDEEQCVPETIEKEEFSLTQTLNSIPELSSSPNFGQEPSFHDKEPSIHDNVLKSGMFDSAPRNTTSFDLPLECPRVPTIQSPCASVILIIKPVYSFTPMLYLAVKLLRQHSERFEENVDLLNIIGKGLDIYAYKRQNKLKVDIEINGEAIDLHMKLGESGEAFFVTEILTDEKMEVCRNKEHRDSAHLATSPMPSSVDLMEKGVMEMKKKHGEKRKKIKKIKDLDEQEESEQNEATGQDSLTEANEQSRKVRRKRSTKRKNQTETPKVESRTDDSEIFEIDDVSSDEELANLARIPPGLSKSISLPVVEENKFERIRNGPLHHTMDSLMYLVTQKCHQLPSWKQTTLPKSDTEVECNRHSKDSFFTEEDTTLWEWGDLPRKSVTEVPTSAGETESRDHIMDPKQSSSGLFQFMKSTRNVRNKPELEGIYLDDLNLEEMSPEVAAILPQKTQFQSIREREEDTESGRGASLPVSPNSVEGAVCGPPVSFLRSEVKSLGAYSMSLCGGLSEGVTLEKFMQKIVTFEDLCDNFGMINNPDLVIRIEEKYYNWLTAAPMILAHLVFERDLPQSSLKKLTDEYMPKKKEKRTSGVSSWFSWGRSSKVIDQSQPQDKQAVQTSMSDSEIGTGKTTDENSTLSPPYQPACKCICLADDDHTSSEADTDSDRNEAHKRVTSEVYKKTIRLDSDSIKKLNLQPGCNEIVYSVTTQFQGTKKCTSHIYLWRYDDKIIVSDIDGTITKSDVLGQILPIIGKDWSQSGVAQLYTSINTNGYKFLYLSARAIGQSKVTKDLLKSIKQEVHVLPEGPLLLSPTSLVSAFHREVIEKKPEEFKIACLKDIGSLFPPFTQAFYAGFGNKVNNLYNQSTRRTETRITLYIPDIVSIFHCTESLQSIHKENSNKNHTLHSSRRKYIPPYRIFTINPQGELKQESHFTFQSSEVYFTVQNLYNQSTWRTQTRITLYIPVVVSIFHCTESLQSIHVENSNKNHTLHSSRRKYISLYRIFTINPRGELKQESHFTFQSSRRKYIPLYRIFTINPRGELKQESHFTFQSVVSIFHCTESLQSIHEENSNKNHILHSSRRKYIPPYRIFTINPRGELKQESHFTFQSSYVSLTDIADHYFPTVIHENALESSEFSNTTFWREPLIQIEDTDLQLLVGPPK